MSQKTFSRENVQGYVFSCPEGAYRSVEAWLDAKAPSNSIIHDTSTQLQALGIPIADAKKLDGIYYRAKVKTPKTVKITLPYVLSHAKLLDISTLKNDSFPGMIFFDKSKNRRTMIGTSAPSKISKG